MINQEQNAVVPNLRTSAANKRREDEPKRHHAEKTMVPESARLEFSMAVGRAGLAALHGEWDELFRSLADPNFIHSPRWVTAYVESLASRPEALRCATVRLEGRLLAVWPLEFRQWGVGPLAVRALCGLAHPHLTLSDIVAHREDSAVWPALVQWLESGGAGEWDMLVIPRLCEDSVLHAWISAEPPARWLTRTVDGSAWLDCAQDFERLLRNASGNHRSSLSRCAKKAERMGHLRYETHTTPETLRGAIEHFVAIEASGWKGKRGGAVACNPAVRAFYDRVSSDMGGHGECEIDLLWLDQQAIGTILWLRAGSTIFLQKIAYLDQLAAIGPGRLIMREALKRVCADPGLRRVSFITRCAWADGWRTGISPMNRHLIFRDKLRGEALFRLFRCLAWLRTTYRRFFPRRDALPARPKAVETTP